MTPSYHRVACAAVLLFLPSVFAALQNAAIKIPQQPSAVSRIAALAQLRLLAEGGFTIDCATGRSVGAVDAWAVSLADAEQRFDRVPTVSDIARYLMRHEQRLRQSPDLYLGGWYDSSAGQWILDITCLIGDQGEAALVGRLNKQKCIFHLLRQEEVWLEETTVFTSISSDP